MRKLSMVNGLSNHDKDLKEMLTGNEGSSGADQLEFCR